MQIASGQILTVKLPPACPFCSRVQALSLVALVLAERATSLENAGQTNKIANKQKEIAKFALFEKYPDLVKDEILCLKTTGSQPVLKCKA